jgi:hypothetical protein
MVGGYQRQSWLLVYRLLMSTSLRESQVRERRKTASGAQEKKD